MTAPLSLAERQGLPDALRVLADAYPRVDWDSHANFGELVRFWMQRHAMFRQLIDVLQADAQRLISAEIAWEAYRPRLSRYGGLLLNELHTHHQVEDHHYFPQLVALDARLERGFDLLESDHDAMDGLLHQMAVGANAVLEGGEAGPFLERLTRFGSLLERHLTDEEDIVVPVILDTGFKG